MITPTTRPHLHALPTPKSAPWLSIGRTLPGSVYVVIRVRTSAEIARLRWRIQMRRRRDSTDEGA